MTLTWRNDDNACIRTRILILILSVGQTLALAADALETGALIPRNFSYRELGLNPQNLQTAQDSRGVIYIANAYGVLEYDGVRWSQLDACNRAFVQSIALDASDTLYVGCENDFGVMAAGEAGRRRFESLADRLPAGERETGIVWRAVAMPHGVYFETRQRLFRYHDGRLTSWTASQAAGFGHLFVSGGELYITDRVRGWLRVAGDRLIDTGLKDVVVRYAGSMAGGSRVLVAQDRLLRFDGKQASAIPLAAGLAGAMLYRAAELEGGALAIGTQRAGLIVIDRKGQVLARVDHRSGLLRDTVNDVFRDRSGGLWLALDAGVSRVEYPTRLTRFHLQMGLEGSVADVVRHAGVLHVATNEGLYRLIAGSPARFEEVAGLGGGVASLAVAGADLLAGGNGGVYRVRGNRAERIYTADDVRAVRVYGERVYVVSDAGAAILENGAARILDSGGYFDVAESAAGAVWLGSLANGALRIEGSVRRRYGTAEGLPKGWIRWFRPGGDLWAVTRAGLYRYDPARDRFEADGSLHPALASGNEVSRVVADRNGDLWVNSGYHNILLRRQASGKYTWDESPFAGAGPVPAEVTYPEADGVVWLGTEDGLFRLDRGQAIPASATSPVLIRAVGHPTASAPFLLNPAAGAEIALPYARNALAFHFAVPVYHAGANVEYQTRLDGIEEVWSEWSREPKRDYTNLPGRAFTFQVRARDVAGSQYGEASLGVEIQPPWYHTWAAYVLYAIGTVLVVGGWIRFRLHWLRARNRELEALVAERTRDVNLKNQELAKRNGELHELISEKNEILGMVSHDLKNPLSAILGYSEELREDAGEIGEGEVRSISSRIHEAASYMLRLATNYLDVCRLEQGLFKIDPKPCSLGEVTSAAVESLRARASEKNIRLTARIDTPGRMVGDPQALLQVMINLVSNGVKYTPGNGEVEVAVSASEGFIQASVRDSGPGISEEDQQRLFRKFERLSAKPTGGESAHGLGLAIVKRLVEAMNGRVWCSSRRGEGATFSVEFPELKAEAVPVRPPAAGTEPQAAN